MCHPEVGTYCTVRVRKKPPTTFLIFQPCVQICGRNFTETTQFTAHSKYHKRRYYLAALAMCCKVMSSFVIFAVLVLRVSCCHPKKAL